MSCTITQIVLVRECPLNVLVRDDHHLLKVTSWYDKHSHCIHNSLFYIPKTLPSMEPKESCELGTKIHHIGRIPTVVRSTSLMHHLKKCSGAFIENCDHIVERCIIPSSRYSALSTPGDTKPNSLGNGVLI